MTPSNKDYELKGFELPSSIMRMCNFYIEKPGKSEVVDIIDHRKS